VSSFRVLVVDDFEPFRRFICSTLRNRTEFQIIGEASDGLEAVYKSESLQPDLIVLDLALPTLNGIAAARRIRTVSPKSKILFVSQESSADVVQEALHVGALGYVVKARAGIELLAAVEAVRQGKRFISAALPSLSLTDNADAQGAYDLCYQEAPASLAPRKGDIPHRHEVQFYSDDASFLDGFTRFIEASLLGGNAVIVAATQSHQKSLLQRLQERGVNIGDAIEEGRYLPLDVPEILSSFMVNDLPDSTRFLTATGDLLAAAAKTAKGEPTQVAVCGECAPFLWAQGNPDAAIQLEHLWDGIAKTYGVDVFCGYVLTDFQSKQKTHICSRICAEHSAFVSR
jgi:DNA-binding NarL/FixJ family response regulator